MCARRRAERAFGALDAAASAFRSTTLRIRFSDLTSARLIVARTTYRVGLVPLASLTRSTGCRRANTLKAVFTVRVWCRLHGVVTAHLFETVFANMSEGIGAKG